MTQKQSDIKAFTFLDRDPQAVASQLLRAGWPKAQVINRAAAVRAWASAIVDAFCAAEESQKGEE